jgi:hypothetical protein
MAAVEFPVEALGSAIGDGAWFLAPGRSRFPRGLPSVSRLKSACLCTAPCQQSPKFAGALLPRKSTLCFEFENAFATFFPISLEARFPPQSSRIWKGGLVCDLEDFDFVHCEIARTRENSFPIQAGVGRVNAAKGTATVGVTANKNAIAKDWADRGITNDCSLLRFALQRKFPRREIVRILQRKKKKNLYEGQSANRSIRPSVTAIPLKYLHSHQKQIASQDRLSTLKLVARLKSASRRPAAEARDR